MMESLAPARIAANMRRFAIDGIDHRNPDHVAAYLLARQSTSRPRSDQIKAILESMNTKSEVGFHLSSEFWLVPKGNLNDDDVKRLGVYIVSEQQLREAGGLPVDTDLSAVYVVEACCPREHLGLGVKRMSFRESFNRTMTHNLDKKDDPSPGNAAGSAALEGATKKPRITWDDSVNPPVAPSAGLPLVVRGSKSAAAAPGSEIVEARAAAAAPGSAAAAPGAVAAEVPAVPPSRRQRVLKLMNSGDQQFQEETEIDHWEELVTKLKKAAKAGNMWSADTSCSTTVHFWAVQVVAAVTVSTAALAPATAASAPGSVVTDDSVGALAAGTAARAPVDFSSNKNLDLCQKLFPEFLWKTLLSQKCFKVLKHFVPLFEDLVKLGCAAPVDVAKLKAFADQDTSCLKVPDLGNFSSGNQKAEKFFFCN